MSDKAKRVARRLEERQIAKEKEKHNRLVNAADPKKRIRPSKRQQKS